MRQLTIALVAALVLAGCGEATPESRPPGEAPDPTPTSSAWRQTVPDGFPLAHGYPSPHPAESKLEGPGPDVNAFGRAVCGEELAPGAPPVATLATTYSGPEDIRSRKLMLFADDAAAQAELERFVAIFAACPEEQDSRHTVKSLRILTTYASQGHPSIGQESIVAVRVGNAVLVSGEYGEGPGATNLDAAWVAANESARRAQPVVDAMCAFSTMPCATSKPAFGPDGYGPLAFGMSHTDASATGQLTQFGDGACITPERGLEALFAHEGMTTPEGIGLGSTREEVETAYAELSAPGVHGYVQAPAGAGLSYQFGFDEDDRVAELNLARNDQLCFG